MNNANYEDPPAAGVEEYFTVPQSMLPPPAQEDLDKKQPRPRPNQDVRANDTKAEENDTPDDTTKKHRNDADYEDPPAAGVEENISVSPRSLLPPSTPEDTTKKHNRERPSQGIRVNDARAEENDGGSRLLRTNTSERGGTVSPAEGTKLKNNCEHQAHKFERRNYVTLCCLGW